MVFLATHWCHVSNWRNSTMTTTYILTLLQVWLIFLLRPWENHAHFSGRDAESMLRQEGSCKLCMLSNIIFSFIMSPSIILSRPHHILSAPERNQIWVFFIHLDARFMPYLCGTSLQNWRLILAPAFFLATLAPWRTCATLTLLWDKSRWLSMTLLMRLCMILLTNLQMLISLQVSNCMWLKFLIQPSWSLILTSVHLLSSSFRMYVYILTLQLNILFHFPFAHEMCIPGWYSSSANWFLPLVSPATAPGLLFCLHKQCSDFYYCRHQAASLFSLTFQQCACNSWNCFGTWLLLGFLDDHTPPLHHLHFMIHALKSIAREGMAYNINDIPFDKTPTISPYALLRSLESSFCDVDMACMVYCLQNSDMMDKEHFLKCFTCWKLKNLKNWPDWDNAFDAQGDAHWKAGCIGVPILQPIASNGWPPNVLKIHWTNSVKSNGTCKACACIDDSRCTAPWLQQFAQTYASCIEQPCMHCFFALAALHALIVIVADMSNAFQQSPLPMEQCYLQIDNAYWSWYRKHYNVDIDPTTHVIPLHKALQGHPKAGALWDHMIIGILEGELGFCLTTHECSLYQGEIDGKLVLICQQVGNFAIAAKDPKTADILMSKINTCVTTQNKGLQWYWLRSDPCNYMKVWWCKSFIESMLQTHGWNQPSPNEKDRQLTSFND